MVIIYNHSNYHNRLLMMPIWLAKRMSRLHFRILILCAILVVSIQQTKLINYCCYKSAILKKEQRFKWFKFTMPLPSLPFAAKSISVFVLFYYYFIIGNMCLTLFVIYGKITRSGMFIECTHLINLPFSKVNQLTFTNSTPTGTKLMSIFVSSHETADSAVRQISWIEKYSSGKNTMKV